MTAPAPPDEVPSPRTAPVCLLAGGTGLVGRAVTRELLLHGVQVRILSRKPRDFPAPEGVLSLGWEDLPAALEGIDAVLNLAGEGIADRPWTPARREQLLRSRLEATARLVDAIGACDRRPEAFVSASAVGFYGTDPGEVDEGSPSGRGFLPGICVPWEALAEGALDYGLRLVKLRLGVVLSREGGLLPRLAGPTRWLGGLVFGNGHQGFNWIHVQDLAAMIHSCMLDHAWLGTVNAVAPQATTHRMFMEGLAQALHRPLWPLPGTWTALGARVLMGARAEELLLRGPVVHPAQARARGFTWRFPELAKALEDLLAWPAQRTPTRGGHRSGKESAHGPVGSPPPRLPPLR